MKTRNSALVAGYSLLLMAVTAGFTLGFAHNSLVVLSDPTQTLKNIQNTTWLFDFELIGWGIVLLTDLVVAWGLYRFFRPVDRVASLVTGVIRAVYAIALAFATYQLLAVRQLLHTNNPDASEVMQLITQFETYWSMGLIIFGLHVVGLGCLSYKSKAVPQWIGFFLYVAGFSYTMINLGKAVIPEAVDFIITAENIMSVPMAISELALAFWLLRKGVRMDFTKNHN